MNPEVLRTAREKVGAYLRGIREHRGLAQAMLSEKCGVDLDRIDDIEAGRVDWSMDEFFAITHALDCYFYLADRGGKHLDPDDLLKNINNHI